MNPTSSLNEPFSKTKLLFQALQFASRTDNIEKFPAIDYFNASDLGSIFDSPSTETENSNSSSLDTAAVATAEKGSIKHLIELLLADKTVDVYGRDHTGWPLILYAVENITVLKLLFKIRPEIAKNFSSITATEPGKSNGITWNPITWAASLGHTESLTFLLRNVRSEEAKTIISVIGKDLNQRSQNTFAEAIKALKLPKEEIHGLLLQAIAQDSASAVKVLLQVQEIAVTEINQLLFQAILDGSAAALKVLLAVPEVDVNATNQERTPLLEQGTPVLIAATRYSPSESIIVELLNAPGINVNATDNQGRTALIQAIAPGGHHEYIPILLTAPDINPNARAISGDTALIWAAIYSTPQPLQDLLKARNIDVNARDPEGKTALIHATIEGRPHCITELVKARGIDVNVRDNEGRTALISAAIFEDPQCLQELLKAPGIDVNVRDNEGRTALISAAVFEDTQCLQELLKAPDIDVNARDNRDCTALMWAAFSGDIKAVQMLLQVSTIDLTHGQAAKAISLARENGHLQCAKLIQAKLAPPSAILSPLYALGSSLAVGMGMYFGGTELVNTIGFSTLANYSALTLGVGGFLVTGAVALAGKAYLAASSANMPANTDPDFPPIVHAEVEAEVAPPVEIEPANAPVLGFRQPDNAGVEARRNLNDPLNPRQNPRP